MSPWFLINHFIFCTISCSRGSVQLNVDKTGTCEGRTTKGGHDVVKTAITRRFAFQSHSMTGDLSGLGTVQEGNKVPT